MEENKTMEKIPCICAMRELYLAFAELENNLLDAHGISLNEAMVLCSIGNGTVTAGIVSSLSGLKPSHVSKIIASVEEQGLVARSLDAKDKRLMCFTLTDAGKSCLAKLKEEGVEVPRTLQPFFRQAAGRIERG